MKIRRNNGILTVALEGRIDSSNAAAVEQEIFGVIGTESFVELVIDADELFYISSAGLRIILKLLKTYKNLRMINVHSDVYDVLEMTGFTELLSVEKAIRKFDVTGLKVIGEGANGVIYRIDDDFIVKVYRDADTIDDIKCEHELSRTAFIHGIPTAIPFGIVRVGESFGSMFELINAKTFAELLQDDPSKVDFIAEKTVKLAKALHATDVPVNIPRQSDVCRQWLSEAEGTIDKTHFEKLRSLIEAIPETDTMLHGDLHIKNIMLYEDEALLIDMDTLCSGHPIYELAFIYNAYEGFGITDKSVVQQFLSVDQTVAAKLLHRILALYLDTEDEDRISDVKEKASVIGLLRVLRRIIRIGEQDTESGRKLLDACRDSICRSVDHLDTLTF